MLRDVQLAPGFPVQVLAEYSSGKSGSDLKELCRSAAMLPVRELVRKANGDFARMVQGQKEVRLRFTWLVYPVTRTAQGFNLRPLTIEDFLDPDRASTVVDPELDHVEDVDVDLTE
jgi:ATPase family AAA domain-containing protein 1